MEKASGVFCGSAVTPPLIPNLRSLGKPAAAVRTRRFFAPCSTASSFSSGTQQPWEGPKVRKLWGRPSVRQSCYRSRCVLYLAGFCYNNIRCLFIRRTQHLLGHVARARAARHLAGGQVPPAHRALSNLPSRACPCSRPPPVWAAIDARVLRVQLAFSSQVRTIARPT